MRLDLRQLQTALEGVATSIGADLVAMEYLQARGRGLLRVYIDTPGGDPRTPRELAPPGVTADHCAAVSRAASAILDETDPIEVPFDLEVSSPGMERPVQKRVDFERFHGATVLLRTRQPVDGRTALEGALAGVRDGTEKEGGFVVRVAVATPAGPTEVEVPAAMLVRARLAEIKPEAPARGKRGAATAKKKTAEAKGAAGGDVAAKGDARAPNTDGGGAA